MDVLWFRISRRPEARPVETLYAGQYVVAANVRVPVLSNPLVRQALSMAIDRATLLNGVRIGKYCVVGAHALLTEGIPIDPAFDKGFLVTAREAPQAAQAHTLIHGHTHRPADHTLPGGATRRVLSDWDLDHAARAQVLRISATGIRRLSPEQACAAA